MSQALLAVLLSTGLLVLLTVLPLVPAILIYRMFPETVVKTTGPLSGLTLKSSGAFSIYVVVFLVLAPFSYRNYNLVASLSSPSWTITGRILITDSDANEVPVLPLDKRIQVALSPDLIEVSKDRFRVKVPEIDERIPTLTFSVGDLGSEVVSFDDLEDNSITLDEDKKQIALNTPVTIRLINAKSEYEAQGSLSPLPAAQAIPISPASAGPP